MCRVNELSKGDTVLFPSHSLLGSSAVTCENGKGAQANNHLFALNYHLEILFIYQCGGVFPHQTQLELEFCNSVWKQGIHVLKMLDLVALSSKKDGILVEKYLLSVAFQKHSSLKFLCTPM